MNDPEHIALLHGGALGDVILTLRLTAAMKQRFPTAHLTLYARVDLSGLAGQVGDVDTFRSVETSALHTLFREASDPDPGCVAELSRFDLLVNCLGGPDARIARRLGALLPGRVFSFDTAPEPGSRDHVTVQWLERLARAGLELRRDAFPRVVLPSDRVGTARDSLVSLTASGDRPIALLHPGSGSAAKCWPLDNYGRLADALGRHEVRPCFLMGPVEMEQHGEPLRDGLARHAPVLCDESLAVAAAWTAAADVYVGNDAGMTHLAAALGTRVVALFGTTDPAVWRPIGAHVDVLGDARGGGVPFDDIDVETVCNTTRHAALIQRGIA